MSNIGWSKAHNEQFEAYKLLQRKYFLGVHYTCTHEHFLRSFCFILFTVPGTIQ